MKAKLECNTQNSNSICMNNKIIYFPRFDTHENDNVQSAIFILGMQPFKIHPEGPWIVKF